MYLAARALASIQTFIRPVRLHIDIVHRTICTLVKVQCKQSNRSILKTRSLFSHRLLLLFSNNAFFLSFFFSSLAAQQLHIALLIDMKSRGRAVSAGVLIEIRQKKREELCKPTLFSFFCKFSFCHYFNCPREIIRAVTYLYDKYKCCHTINSILAYIRSATVWLIP